MDNWLILQNFYNGLTQSSRDHVDAAAGGAFFSLTIERATSLIEKMVSNHGWSDDRLQLRQRGMHSVKEADMLAMKIDLLLKKFEDYCQDKAQLHTLQASMSASLTECMPRWRGWRRSSLQLWLDTIFSINDVALSMVSEKKAPPQRHPHDHGMIESTHCRSSEE